MTREIMRAGQKAPNPEWTEEQLQTAYVERILSYHGLSLAKIEAMRKADAERAASSPRSSERQIPKSDN